MAVKDQRAETQRRLDRAKLAGVSDADLAMSAFLITSLFEALGETLMDPKVSMVAGLLIGAGIAIEDQEAAKALSKAVSIMVDVGKSVDFLNELLIPTYLEKRREMLDAMDRGHRVG